MMQRFEDFGGFLLISPSTNVHITAFPVAKVYDASLFFVYYTVPVAGNSSVKHHQLTYLMAKISWPCISAECRVSASIFGVLRDTSPAFHLWHACPKSIFTIHKCFCLAKKDEMSTVLLKSAYLSNQLQLSDFTGHAVEATRHVETVTCFVMLVTAICFPNNALTRKTLNM